MDFAAMFQTWMNVLTKPGEATFQEELEKPHATIASALIWIVIAAVITAVFSMIGAVVGSLLSSEPGFMQSMMGSSDIPPEVAAQMAAFTGASIGGGIVFACVGTLILAPLGFLIGSAIYFLIAKLVGGQGGFEQHTFALATFSAPLMIVNGFLSIIPVLGGCVSFLVYIYQIVLTYFAMKVTHNLSTGMALVVALVPLVIGLICAATIFFIAFMLIFGAIAGNSGGF